MSSSTFAKNGFEMGWKLLKSSRAAFSFLGTGVSAGTINAAGTTPNCNDLFIILRTEGQNYIKARYK